MSRHDEWCELCEDKMKEERVPAPQPHQHMDVCGHCASLYTYPPWSNKA